jgi:SAM-dependent methyltransferase
MKQQSDNAQKGEIEFRKKLSRQQINGDCFFENEYDSKGIEKILIERMKKTLDNMVSLRGKNYVLSPYLEIGAERCQRSLVMENDLDACGAAVDISYDMLKSCNYYREAFNKTKFPLRICCDANNLPFLSGSIPFVFCYETLHHFPEPSPIVKEIHRVLQPGGHFFFHEEPFKKVLHINLYKEEKTNSKRRAKTRIRKIKTGLDIFFAKKTCNEIEHGIIENHDISLRNWKKTLNLFEDKNINLLKPSIHNCSIRRIIQSIFWRTFSEGKFLGFAEKQVYQSETKFLFKKLSFVHYALKKELNQS